MQDRIEIRDIPERRLIGVPHRGPYDQISAAFARLDDILDRDNLRARAGAMVALFHASPEEVAPADLRSFAAVEMDRGTATPDGAEEVILPAGPAAVLAHHGSYAGLPAAYGHLFGDWLPASGREVGGKSYELYHNTPDEVPADRLVTDIHLPLKP